MCQPHKHMYFPAIPSRYHLILMFESNHNRFRNCIQMMAGNTEMAFH
jgi:hypothetical protein